MAVTSNLVLDQGSSFSVVVRYINNDGTAVDLTGYQARSQMRRSYYSANATTLGADISDAANGNVTLTLNANTTANIKAGRYLYDVEVVENATYTVTRIIEGIITVLPEVTK
jgi:hypothetical protein